MHDNKPNADLGKGSSDGSGEKFYALGERLETDNNDPYDNYGTNIYGNGKISKYEDLQFLHDDSFQEIFVNITQTSCLGRNQEVSIQCQDDTMVSNATEDFYASQEQGRSVAAGMAGSASNIPARVVVQSLASSSNERNAVNPPDGTHSWMSSSTQQQTNAISTFYENLVAWENGTFFKSKFNNLDDIKLDRKRINHIHIPTSFNDAHSNEIMHEQRHHKEGIETGMMPPCISADDGATDFSAHQTLTVGLV